MIELLCTDYNKKATSIHYYFGNAVLVLFHPDIDLLHAFYAACVDSSVLENLGTVVTVSETHTFL